MLNAMDQRVAGMEQRLTDKALERLLAYHADEEDEDAEQGPKTIQVPKAATEWVVAPAVQEPEAARRPEAEETESSRCAQATVVRALHCTRHLH
jgi:outer membrane biosynthesis protein TonB